jgi:hypothetical protein
MGRRSVQTRGCIEIRLIHPARFRKRSEGFPPDGVELSFCLMMAFK